MDYNARINWTDGMALSASVLRQFEADMLQRDELSLRAAVGGGLVGLLPGSVFAFSGAFVRKNYEITGLECTALLPSGRMLSASGDFVVDIAASGAVSEAVEAGSGELYVVLREGGQSCAYERGGVGYVSSKPEFEVFTAQQLRENPDVLPLQHFFVENRTLRADSDYIVPTLVIAGEPRLGQYLEKFALSLRRLAEHRNLDKSEGRRALLRCAFELRCLDVRRLTPVMMELCRNAVLTASYFVVEVMGAGLEALPEGVASLQARVDEVPWLYDVNAYLAWMGRYLEALPEVLDRVVLRKDEIDIEAVKREIESELSARLTESLEPLIRERLTDELVPKLTDDIRRSMLEHIEGELRPQLRRQLGVDLRDPMYRDLYDALMDALSGMCVRSDEKVEDTYMPMI